MPWSALPYIRIKTMRSAVLCDALIFDFEVVGASFSCVVGMIIQVAWKNAFQQNPVVIYIRVYEITLEPMHLKRP